MMLDEILAPVAIVLLLSLPMAIAKMPRLDSVSVWSYHACMMMMLGAFSIAMAHQRDQIAWRHLSLIQIGIAMAFNASLMLAFMAVRFVGIIVALPSIVGVCVVTLNTFKAPLSGILPSLILKLCTMGLNTCRYLVISQHAPDFPTPPQSPMSVSTFVTAPVSLKSPVGPASPVASLFMGSVRRARSSLSGKRENVKVTMLMGWALTSASGITMGACTHFAVNWLNAALSALVFGSLLLIIESIRILRKAWQPTLFDDDDAVSAWNWSDIVEEDDETSSLLRYRHMHTGITQRIADEWRAQLPGVAFAFVSALSLVVTMVSWAETSRAYGDISAMICVCAGLIFGSMWWGMWHYCELDTMQSDGSSMPWLSRSMRRSGCSATSLSSMATFYIVLLAFAMVFPLISIK